eukprot:CAMPEP_0114585476 /NCGR_PEP_ID=MMETSP0125-20121206/9010_1 /TAXON_ID=485358 ORGANISM="Aristerostoma sp., Strain ATCC 50986" /NCGR_SAMPLE_ID=MMETSP0125 /ASSEMBLY_ACC=CAM_ASM_000245 /LENGTH=403 /DNA_ID=CAMNT_0001780573 /DNA_START=46 /DNA_END=1257 /DNA_ORIENTATION=+
MRTAAVLCLLALSASVMSLDFCTEIVGDGAFYNLAPFGKNNRVLNATDPHNDKYQLNFSLCNNVVKSCNGSKEIYGIRFDVDDTDTCDDIAVAGPKFSLYNAKDDTKGVNVTYPLYNGSDNGGDWNLKLSIICDPKANSSSPIPDFTFVENGKELYATVKSYYGCSPFTLGKLATFMQDNQVLFVVIFFVLGIFVAFFGLKMFNVTIFILAAVSGFFVSAILFYQLASYGSAAWVMWVLFFTCLVIGCALGYLAIKFEKAGFFAVGFCLGGIGFSFLYSTILGSFLHFSKAVFYVVGVLCGLIGGGLAMWIYKDILIIATSFIGSYLSVRSVSVYVGGFPSESALINGQVKWSASAIGYLVVIGVMTAGAMYVQFKNKKKEEDEKDEANPQNIYKNMITDNAY